MSIYTEEGYESRKDYLTCLADDYGLEANDVFMLASMLGSNEDFDGLVTSVQDYADQLEGI